MQSRRVAGWSRSAWPMPDFVRREPISKQAWIVRYSDADPLAIIEERPTDYDSKLDTDAAFGYGAVEIRLTKLLS